VYTPATSGSLSDQYSDGSGVNALNFGGVAVGYYDTYSQTFATTAGDSYTLRLNFTEDNPNENGFLVTTNASAVPEPATWAMMLVGFGAFAVALRSSRRKDFGALAAA
jgi:PEP-CTERM motif